jgi:hypothetical protein
MTFFIAIREIKQYFFIEKSLAATRARKSSIKKEMLLIPNFCNPRDINKKNGMNFFIP